MMDAPAESPARDHAPPPPDTPERTEWLFRAAVRAGEFNPLLHLLRRYREGERC